MFLNAMVLQTAHGTYFTSFVSIIRMRIRTKRRTTLNLIINKVRLFLLQRLNNVLNHYLMLLYTNVFAYILGTSSFIMARIYILTGYNKYLRSYP